MFVILAYDINQKRVGKILRICRKYLVHVQKSVFEGRLTEGQLNKLKKELGRVIDPSVDSICIYCMESIKYTVKQQMGVIKQISNII